MLPTLQRGDCLLYNSSDLIDLAIRVKTWSPVAHCEAYVGSGLSVASRNGIGVGCYQFRRDGLRYVLRPRGAFVMESAMTWFKGVRGQAYDWLGLLCFTLAVKQGSHNKQFCSEFLKRWYEAGGFFPLHRSWDADKTAPGNFLMSPNFDWINV